jgi:hypothetical protein
MSVSTETKSYDFEPLKLSEQEIFDQFLSMMRARGWQAATDPVLESCVYRSDIGPCAIGMLIPNELYSPALEGVSLRLMYEFQLDPDRHFVGEDIEIISKLLYFFSQQKPNFLRGLQSLHDDMFRAGDSMNKEQVAAFGEDQARMFAERFNLKYTAPKE